MEIAHITRFLDKLAPTRYQESYDNSGLLVGNLQNECTGILVTLDVTEDVVNEAVSNKCNLIVAHHPIIFGGLKKITGKNYVERTVIAAIKNDIAIYAIHTNLDNMINGVSGKMAEKLQLKNCKVLAPKSGTLMKLGVFVPHDHAETVKSAAFAAGAGHIGNYSECSFSTDGTGTFKPEAGANPFSGELGKRETASEAKLEFIVPVHLQQQVLNAVFKAHPYEEVAYDVSQLENANQTIGSGIIGELSAPMHEDEFLQLLKTVFGLKAIRHTPLLGKQISRVALCGGAGSFLIKPSIAAGADIYISGDIKYHEFFDAENKIVVADIGHWESEQFTVELLHDVLHTNFPTFAVLKTSVNTNPVNYFF